MPNFVGGLAVKNVADETVAVRGHGDKIDMFLTREFDDFVGRLTEREHGIAGKAFAAQLALAFFQIGAVLFHFLALGKLELIEISRDPTIGDVDEQQSSASHARKRFDVAENRFVSIAVFERDENVSIHFRNDEIRMTKLERKIETPN